VGILRFLDISAPALTAFRLHDGRQGIFPPSGQRSAGLFSSGDRVLGSLTYLLSFYPHSKIYYLRSYGPGYSDTFVRLLPAASLQAPNGESEMPSVGLNRFFASTSLALLLLTDPATLANPTGAGADAAKRAPGTVRLSTKAGLERTMMKPADSGDETEAPSSSPTMLPALLAKPDESKEQLPSVAAPAPIPTHLPLTDPEAPVATLNPGTAELSPPVAATQTPTPNPQPAAEPEAPGAAAAQPANPEPATPHGDDAITVIVPPASPVEPGAIPGPATVVDVDAPIAEQLHNSCQWQIRPHHRQ
jgi:hypothetical protein